MFMTRSIDIYIFIYTSRGANTVFLFFRLSFVIFFTHLAHFKEHVYDSLETLVVWHSKEMVGYFSSKWSRHFLFRHTMGNIGCTGERRWTL